MRKSVANKSGKVRRAHRELFALHSRGARPKGSSSTGSLQTHAVRLYPRDRSSRSRMNIVVLPHTHKHKVLSTRSEAGVPTCNWIGPPGFQLRVGSVPNESWMLNPSAMEFCP